LGFLGASPFRPEDPHLLLLVFLGFSRPNRDFSMGYAGFLRENFSRAFSAG
jgi:hypothetical protein